MQSMTLISNLTSTLDMENMIGSGSALEMTNERVSRCGQQGTDRVGVLILACFSACTLPQDIKLI